MIARAILPWFGGAAGVWNCSQFFFQAVLLLGYTYAHLTITGVVRTARPALLQGRVHLVLIALSLFFLPVLPSAHWKPTPADDPALWVFLTLGATIGLPYLVLSSTSPLVASWYARLLPGRSPYPLFAWSNLGSFLGLLGYPLILEPLLGVRNQAWVWSLGYLICAALLAYFAYRQQTLPLLTQLEGAAEMALPEADTLLLWLALPLCSSVLLVALTHYISTEVAAVPLLWVIPLALYLFSYIVVASSWNLYRREVFLPLFALSLYGVERLLDPDGFSPLSIVGGLWVCLSILFIVIHGELWQHRPDPRQLSSFYLIMSLGGAIGSFLVAYLFPTIFSSNYELSLVIFVCPILVLWSALRERARTWTSLQGIVLLLMVLPLLYLLGHSLIQKEFQYGGSRIASMRNFYGSAWVSEIRGANPKRGLYNGRINHGGQFLHNPTFATGYFSRRSGIGRTFSYLQSQRPKMDVGIVGLGVGTLAAYGRPGDDFSLYELDPKIELLANRFFTFLPQCAARHRVVLGDARLSLEQEKSDKFDLLVIDAFTGDSIPIHLLTQEAFQTYARVLKPDGVLALHVSNLYLDLPPVVAAQAKAMGRDSLACLDVPPGTEEMVFPSNWAVVIPRDGVGIETGLRQMGFQPLLPGQAPLWTDDNNNLLKVVLPESLPVWLRPK